MKQSIEIKNKEENFNIIKPPGGFSLDLKELWQYRELAYIFTWRDIVSKYKQTILGFVWLIIQPLSMIAIFTFFFSGALNISTDNIPPPVFYFSGLLVWNFFRASITNTANSVIRNGAIIKKIYFPRIILPLAYVFIALFDFIIAFVIFFIMIIGYELMMPEFKVNYFPFLFYPLAILMVVFSSFGIGCVLASLNVRFRDVRLVVGFFVRALFYLTPVIYPVSIFESEKAQMLLAINPAVGAINLMRAPFVDEPISFSIIMIGCFSSLFIFMLGTYMFRKTEYYFADLA